VEGVQGSFKGAFVKVHLNLMPRNMDMSNIDERKPPLPKGRGTTEGGGGIQKRDLVHRKRIPQSSIVHCVNYADSPL